MMSNENDIFNPEENTDSQGKKKQVNTVFILGAAIIVCAVALTCVLIGTLAAAEKNKKESTTGYETTTNNNTETTTDEDYLNSVLGVGEQTATQPEETKGNSAEATEGNNYVKDTTKNALIESYEHLSVNGENYLSDHYSNEFIQLVEREYGVDTDLLVAIYSVPDSGTNFVLQFNGKTNRDGEVIKSPDTLEKVYQIDLDKNIKIATGTNKGNVGVSYPESVMSFNMVKKIVMNQYPDYFSGLDK